MFRDRRVISGAFITPIFVIVLILMLVGFLQGTIKETKGRRVAIVNYGHESHLQNMMRANDSIKLVPVQSPEDAEKLVKDGDVRSAIVIPADFDDKVVEGAAETTVYFDPADNASQITLGIVMRDIAAFSKAALIASLKANHLSENLAEPIKVVEKQATKAKGMGASQAILGFLPYVIILWAFYGGFSTASDLVAGEKERGTLETLMISPISRLDIALGKYWALALVCLLSSLTSLVGILIVGLLRLPFTKDVFHDGFTVTLPALLAIFAVVIPLVGFFAGILLAVSAIAKNMREAQTYLAVLNLVVMVPAIFSQFIGFTDIGKERWVAFTPVLNAAVALRQALTGNLDGLLLAATISINIVIGLLALLLVVRLFHREQILART